jgi:PTS system nitrogen regulatory IIA component
MPQSTEQTEILNAEQVARRYKVAQSTVYEWADKGVLPAIRLGGTVRFRNDALIAFENEQLTGTRMSAE